tara:strand:+ start:210 stop:413 length:204 start_codon:yes stop_codon:yes gene_type:complete
MESKETGLSDLIKKVNDLLNRFNEQKGIIDHYIKQERVWKENKILQAQEIESLKRDLTKLQSKSEHE